jgi:hypothetical protein
MQFWRLENGQWRQKRLSVERVRVSDKAQHGRTAAHARWLKDNGSGDADASAEHPSGNAQTMESTTTTTSRKSKTPDDDADDEKTDQEFERFWADYPHKINKAAARKAFTAAIAKTTLGAMLAALERQKPGWRDPRYTPHPTSWLNGERWSDQPVVGKSSGEPMTEERMAALEERYRQKRIREGWDIPDAKKA